MILDMVLTLAAALLGCFLFLRWLMACGLRQTAEVSFFAVPSSRRKLYSTHIQKRRGLYRQENCKIFLIALSFRLILLFLCLLITLLLTQEGSEPALLQGLIRGDSVHYVNLVEKGYTGYMENGEHLFLVFFPLYVWLVRAVNVLLGNTLLSGLTMSFLCYSAACVFLYRLAREELGRLAAQRTVVFLSVFPFSFFFGTVMTESLFLLTTSASFLYIRRHQWLRAGLFGILAALTRMHGLLLIVAAGAELLETNRILSRDGRSWKERFLPVLKGLPFVFLPLVGTGGYLLLNEIVDGNPFAFLIHQQHWNQGFLWFSQTLQYVGENAISWADTSTRAAIWIPQIFLFILFFIALALCWRKLPSMYTLYAFFYLILNYSLSWLLSAGRYLSCGIPFFLFAAVLTNKRPALEKGLTAGMAALMGIYLFAWLNGASIY